MESDDIDDTNKTMTLTLTTKNKKKKKNTYQHPRLKHAHCIFEYNDKWMNNLIILNTYEYPSQMLYFMSYFSYFFSFFSSLLFPYFVWFNTFT